jgi:hypothetical protein
LQRRDYINRKNKTEKGEKKKSGKSYCCDIGGTDTPQIEKRLAKKVSHVKIKKFHQN